MKVDKFLPLLMTASVDPRGMVGADFVAEDRENMYVETLVYYIRTILTNPLQRIVFTENSGWNLDSLVSKLPPFNKEQIEFVSHDPNNFDITKGKGYNEFLMINRTIEMSNVIQDAGAFMKVTGRYPVYNMEYFLRKGVQYIFEKGYSFYGDMKDHSLYDWLHTGWNGHAGYTVLFATTVDNWKNNLGPRYVEMNDEMGRLAEDVMFDYMKPFRGIRDSGVCCRFKREPICGGVQGSQVNAVSFSKSNKSLKARMMRLAGNCIRTFTPWFWF